ncbi:MAG: amidohydrolase family protein, partial [Bacteroidaceae bacterium]|nr:amidohydrolase family protein [Bacteroidaceae bacterium]
LVDDDNQLRRIFQHVPLPIMTHCEDTTRINRRMAQAKERYGPDPAVEHHPEIRDAEACFLSTELAVRLARETGARLHVAHISTARELALFQPNDDQITAEACVPHLLYSDADYPRLGSLIKCNPAIKTDADREALRGALSDGRIRCVATDHAPHLPSEKEGGACRAMSGMPMVQFSLVSMLQLVDERVLTLERMVQLMCHHPAELFQISQRGFIREGYWADLVLVRRNESPWKLVPECIQSRCGWSPRMGDLFHWSVLSTWVNGCRVWDGEQVDTKVHGAPVLFRR